MRIDSRAFAFALLSLVGCASEPAPAPNERAEPSPRVASLEASNVVVSGVVLPRGLEHAYDADGASVYRTDLPAERVFEYFVARHPDARVERIGAGGVLRRVKNRDARGDTVGHVDVSVLGRSNGGARVQVTPLPEAADELRSEEERLRDFAEHVRTLD